MQIAGIRSHGIVKQSKKVLMHMPTTHAQMFPARIPRTLNRIKVILVQNPLRAKRLYLPLLPRRLRNQRSQEGPTAMMP